MHPTHSISKKQRVVVAGPQHNNTASLSPQETKSVDQSINTTATARSGRHSSSSSSSGGKDQCSHLTMREASAVASSFDSPSLLPMMTETTSPPRISATTPATASRKRARELAEHSSDANSPTGQSPTELSDAGVLRCRKTRTEQDEAEVFLDMPTTRASLGHLQQTPTSQLLSQQLAAPYAEHSDDTGDISRELPVEQMLFTPATVARRPQPPVILGEAPRSSASSTASTLSVVSPAASSESRPSSHDEAVQAILRAGPPTTTRLVQLKPGYQLPSPQTPLWTALEDDGDDDDDAAAGDSSQTLGETLLNSDTQVSPFQLADEEEADKSGTTATTMQCGALPRSGRNSAITSITVPTVGGHVPATTRESRRLGTRAAGSGSISLPAPGRSICLLDEDGLHEDERLPLFIGIDSDGQGGMTDSEYFSLTQEANRQERAQDTHVSLPRSRKGRGKVSPAAARVSSTAMPHAGKRGSANMSTPSPARQGAARTFARTAQQSASPYSQLQRDVENTMVAAAATARSEGGTTAPAAAVVPHASLSQKELRWKSEMLKWAERTRAFFHFIDTRPLHVTSSPPKSSASASSRPQRESRSQSIANMTRRGSMAQVSKQMGNRASTSMSLVRRSSSTSVVPAASSLPVVAHRSHDSAFDAVVSRVKREAAAMITATRSTSAK